MWFTAIGMAGLIVASGLGLVYQTRGSAVLDYSHEAGFWNRNKNQLGLMAVGAVLGVLGTLLIKMLASG